MSERALTAPTLPFGAVGRKGVGWWGVMTLIATEACLFVYLLFAYAFTAMQDGRAYLPDQPPSWRLAGPNTVVLILSSVAVWWGERGVKRGRRGQLIGGLAAAIVLGAIFAVVQLLEWKGKTFTMASSGYGSHYFTITGFHMAHVVGGLLAMTALLAWSVRGYFDARRHTAVLTVAAYWHFVDVVWLVVFTTFYVAPYLV